MLYPSYGLRILPKGNTEKTAPQGNIPFLFLFFLQPVGNYFRQVETFFTVSLAGAHYSEVPEFQIPISLYYMVGISIAVAFYYALHLPSTALHGLVFINPQFLLPI